MLIDNILEFNTAGWATFPVISSGEKAKEPACKDWASRVPDIFAASGEEEAYKKAGAYGIVLRPADLIIDIDPRGFTEGVNSWKKLREDLGLGVIHAPCVKTGGGGLHLYFSKPANAQTVAQIKGYPGIDIKSGGKGAYVLGPGSAHPSGRVYEWLNNGLGFDDIKPLPDKLWALVEKQETSLPAEGSLNGGPQDYGRYIKWLKDQAPAVEGQGGDHQTYKVAVKGRDFGLPAKETYRALLEDYNSRCNPPWGEEELKRKVYNAYKYAQGSAGIEDPARHFEEQAVDWDNEADKERKWDMDKSENPKKTLRNAINYLYISPELKDTIRLNLFTGDIEMAARVPWHKKRVENNIWTDTDVILLKYHLAKTKRIEFSTAMLWEALHTVSIRWSYHPIRDYVKNLTWDGIPRLDSWLTKYCGAHDNAYTQSVGRKTLIGMVARVFRPGIKFDYCTVLEGDQGIGKSTVCAILGGEWYGDIVLDPHARDTIDAMRGKWVIELSEMEVTKRSDAQALKAFVSRTSDRARLAYARSALDFPRQCVFMGTINPDEMGYLSDSTGNRRFWPVKCGDKIDMDGLAEVRDQLLAEAYAAYKSGEQLYLDHDISKLAELEQAERLHEDPWADVIAAWLDSAGDIDQVTVHQVWELALAGMARDLKRPDQCRIGRALKELGFNKHRIRTTSGRAYVYRREKIDIDQRMEELTGG